MEVRDSSVPRINSKYKGNSIVGISRFNGSFDLLIGENGNDFMDKFLENFYSSENLDYYLVKVYSGVHFESIKPVLNNKLCIFN